MNQRELALSLGVDEAVVSRDLKRGMPSHTVAAARAWRNNNIRPYVRASGPASRSPSVDADFEMIARLGVMEGRDTVLIVAALAQQAADLIPLGRFAEIERPLRAALRAVPATLREQVGMPMTVWFELVREARDLALRLHPSPTGEPKQAPQIGRTVSRLEDGFWWDVAAGQWKDDGSPIPAP